MFTCKYCKKECSSKKSLVNHERLCKKNPEYNPNKFQCQHCGRYFSSTNGYTIHVGVCADNPERDPEKYGPWNLGKTKETSESLAGASKKLKTRLLNGEDIGAYGRKGELNYASHLDVRAKISASMKGNHNNNPSKTGRGKKGWYKGFFCASTYELAFIIYCLDHNIPVTKCTDSYQYSYRGEIHRYYPDFIVNDTIIEIKGFWTEVVDVKTSSVDNHSIKVLYYDDLKPVFDYIDFTYNKKIDVNLHDMYE